MSEIGMVFDIVERKLTESGERKLARRIELTEDDFAVTRTPYVVAHGQWVMRGYSDPVWQQRYVGDPARIERVALNVDTGEVLWVSDAPFGMLSWQRTLETWLPGGGIRFESAKQVWRGHLGQLVPTPKLRFIREDKLVVRPYATGRRRRRSHIGWGKVADLMQVTGLTFAEIVERFWPFVDFAYVPGRRFPAVLKVVVGTSAADIKARRREVQEVTQAELLQTLESAPSAYDDVWIPEGLIRTILRLIALGYTPVEQIYA